MDLAAQLNQIRDSIQWIGEGILAGTYDDQIHKATIVLNRWLDDLIQQKHGDDMRAELHEIVDRTSRLEGVYVALFGHEAGTARLRQQTQAWITQAVQHVDAAIAIAKRP